jgi:parallel beta-helix repeat protein
MDRVKLKGISALKIVQFIFLTILLAVPIYAGNTYYVNGAAGNDSNPGTQSLPWKTIQKAANTLIAGDTVVIQPGTYNERVVVTRSGNSGSYIALTAQGTVQCKGFTIRGDYVKVSGFTVTATQGTWSENGFGIWVQATHCLIEDNLAYYCPSGGLILRPESASCVVRNNRFHRNGRAGIDIRGSNQLVENNEIWGSINYHTPTAWNAMDADGIIFFGSGHIIRGNYIHDISYSDPENQGRSPHIDGFQTWEDLPEKVHASNVWIERNLIVLPVYYDASANGHGFMLHECSYITIRNNIVVTHGGTNTGGPKTSHHLTIENNTFIGSLAFNRAYSPVGISLKDCPNSTVRNNIVYDQADWAIHLEGTTSTGLNVGDNCTYNSNGTNPQGTRQSGDLWGVDPRFVNAASRDYHLQSNSPCINAGASIPDNTRDYENNPRPISSAWDMGSYEYNGAGTSLSANANASPTSGQAPLTVNFTGSATGGTSPYSYRWTFGDGGSSTSQNPSHTYSSAGNYTATLTVTDSQSATNSKSLTITATSTSSQLIATASASTTSGQAPLTVNFTGSATGGTSPYSYRWTFGDGGSSTSQNPSHTYSSAGNYTATLTVTDSQSATNSKSLTITATSGPSQLMAAATASPTSGEAPLTVNFTGSATGGTAPYSYSWTFGDGGSSTSQNPSHTYSSDGNYAATVTVTDLSFVNASATVNITVGEIGTTATLSLAAQTGAPAPGQGGTTNPSPGNHSFSIGSTVSVRSIANTDYRFSKWAGDIIQPSMFNSTSALTMNNNKSLAATFCTKCADINGDLKITPGDAQRAFDIYLGRIANPTWCELENGDVNCSGTKLSPKVTPADAQWIFHKYIRRGEAISDCSGNSRAAAVTTELASFINANLTIDNMAFTPDLDILIPIIIECPSEVTAFGFDLTFPSNVLTFIRLESTELTKGYDQLDANVMPYQPINQEQGNAEPAETLVLRVGGYKTNPDQSPSSGVLVTLIFRGTGEFIDPNATSIIATYDDLQNASVINRMISRQDNSQIRENKRQGKNVKRILPGKRSDY